MSDILSDVVFARLIRLVGVLCLIGALAGFTFVLLQMMRQAPRRTDEPNWRFLFSCWADSVAIMILYASVNFVWLYDRFAEMTRQIAYDHYPIGQQLNSQYMMLVVEIAIYAVIMIIAIRLFLKIRRYLEDT